MCGGDNMFTVNFFDFPLLPRVVPGFRFGLIGYEFFPYFGNGRLRLCLRLELLVLALVLVVEFEGLCM